MTSHAAHVNWRRIASNSGLKKKKEKKIQKAYRDWTFDFAYAQSLIFLEMMHEKKNARLD